MRFLTKIFLALSCLTLTSCATISSQIPKSERLAAVKASRLMPLQASLREKGFELGAPIFIRIFKETSELEVWIKKGETYSLFKNYPICKYSGYLGPKLKEGDRQAPEGIYKVEPNQLNPLSDSHLSFNLGFPNSFDLAHNRTGSYLMVHGGCGSIGCYAMTDPAIEEIYLMVEAALVKGQKQVQVHALPFRFSAGKLEENAQNQWIDFWKELASIDDLFEKSKRIPQVNVVGTHYVTNGFQK